VISTLSNPELVLTSNNENVGFVEEEQPKKLKNMNGQLLKQCFVFNKSHLYPGEVTIQSAHNNNYLYNTLNDEVFLRPFETTSEFSKNTTFYPLYPKCEETDYVSFRTINQNQIKLLGSYANSYLKLFNNSNNIQLKGITCFYPKLINTNIYITIKSVYNGSYLKVSRTINPDGTKTIGGSLMFVSDKNATSDMKFKIIGDYPNGLFYLMASNERFIEGNLGNKLKATIPNKYKETDAILFELQQEGTMYNIVNNLGEFMTINSDMSITLKKDKPLRQEAVYDEKNIQLSPNVYGPTLGNKKRFIIKVIYEIA
jgi:hypothetical protein